MTSGICLIFNFI